MTEDNTVTEPEKTDLENVMEENEKLKAQLAAQTLKKPFTSLNETKHFEITSSMVSYHPRGR